MSSKGLYYVGRVLKLGLLDQASLMDAIRRPAVISRRGNSWTLIDVKEFRDDSNHFFFGRLSKYAPEGEVGVVDEATRSERKQTEPNLLVAASPFIYVPEHSGIVFLHVPNQVEVSTFRTRFAEIIEEAFQSFFAKCHIDLVSDLKTFAAKLSSLDGIYKIDAKVSPPNPLFSPLWASIESYLRTRNTDRMTIIEDAPKSDVLKTDLPRIVEQAAEQDSEHQFIPESPLAIGDAAILMAADGYGSGTIRGVRAGELVVIRTSETALNFTFDKTPDPSELYLRALEILERIKEQRHMEHGK